MSPGLPPHFPQSNYARPVRILSLTSLELYHLHLITDSSHDCRIMTVCSRRNEYGCSDAYHDSHRSHLGSARVTCERLPTPSVERRKSPLPWLITFATEVYHQIKTKSGNLVFSPYSLFMALNMTCAGARQDTETQITEVLHFPAEPSQVHQALNAWNRDPGSLGAAEIYELYNANALWAPGRTTVAR